MEIHPGCDDDKNQGKGLHIEECIVWLEIVSQSMVLKIEQSHVLWIHQSDVDDTMFIQIMGIHTAHCAYG